MNKNEKGWLKEIDMYLAKQGFPQAPFTIRILILPDEELGPNRTYSTSRFVDCSSKVIPFTGKAGWNKVDLDQYNIPLRQKDFLTLLTPLDDGEKFKWRDKKTVNGMGRYFILKF